MSLRIIQPPRKSASGAVGGPRAARNGAKVSADLPMYLLVAVEIPLCRLGSCAALVVASVWERMSIDVAAGEICISIRWKEVWSYSDLLEQ
jgi:hypothetical protein